MQPFFICPGAIVGFRVIITFLLFNHFLAHWVSEK